MGCQETSTSAAETLSAEVPAGAICGSGWWEKTQLVEYLCYQKAVVSGTEGSWRKEEEILGQQAENQETLCEFLALPLIYCRPSAKPVLSSGHYS